MARQRRFVLFFVAVAATSYALLSAVSERSFGTLNEVPRSEAAALYGAGCTCDSVSCGGGTGGCHGNTCIGGGKAMVGSPRGSSDCGASSCSCGSSVVNCG
jgi:hypothetical protein